MDEKKIREAIKAMENQIAIIQKIPEYLGLKEKTDKQIEERQTAIEALEKQLPKKTIDKSCVKDNDTIYGHVGICPSCNGIVDDSMIVCDCTQVLDWSE